MKICHIVGNRPQFVKLAPVLRALKTHRKVRNIVVHTGQHYDYAMSQLFFEQLGMPAPDHNLEVGSGTHGVQTGRMLEHLDGVLLKERPDVAVVYGDTNTTLAGALAAYKLEIAVAHVESGLREFIWRPEEVNRKFADHCSTFALCPTKTAVRNLRAEGVSADRIFMTGDVTFDAFLWGAERRHTRQRPAVDVPAGQPYAIMTMHRAETVDKPRDLKSIVSALLKLPLHLVFTVHPRTEKRLREDGLLTKLKAAKHVHLLPPIGYFEFVDLLLDANLVITDSGGVIKEAFYARKPCVTLDDSTEYLEIQRSKANIWAGKRTNDILAAVTRMLRHDPSRIRPELVFGDGNAATRIAAVLTR